MRISRISTPEANAVNKLVGASSYLYVKNRGRAGRLNFLIILPSHIVMPRLHVGGQPRPSVSACSYNLAPVFAMNLYSGECE
jgi:hypothetical protein